nr:hypothetical protein Q903MT_gene3341 [Picea sitchensis]
MKTGRKVRGDNRWVLEPYRWIWSSLNCTKGMGPTSIGYAWVRIRWVRSSLANARGRQVRMGISLYKGTSPKRGQPCACPRALLLPCQNGFRATEWIKELRAFPIPAAAPAKAIEQL